MPNDVAELTYIQYVIAGQLDLPSVYMGGPSHPSLRRAREVIAALQDHDVSFVIDDS